MIGGKPNLALYFIGCVEDEVLYLDPHTTQKSVLIEKDFSEQIELDASYHCKHASRIPILSMDPSIALVIIFTKIKKVKKLKFVQYLSVSSVVQKKNLIIYVH